MQVEYIKCLAFDDRLLLNGRGQSHVTCFFIFCPNHIFEISEATHFKFRVLMSARARVIY